MLSKIVSISNDGEQDSLDGITVNYHRSWFNVRTSNTESLLRLNAEAETQTELDEVVNRVKEVLNSA